MCSSPSLTCTVACRPRDSGLPLDLFSRRYAPARPSSWAASFLLPNCFRACVSSTSGALPVMASFLVFSSTRSSKPSRSRKSMRQPPSADHASCEERIARAKTSRLRSVHPAISPHPNFCAGIFSACLFALFLVVTRWHVVATPPHIGAPHQRQTTGETPGQTQDRPRETTTPTERAAGRRVCGTFTCEVAERTSGLRA